MWSFFVFLVTSFANVVVANLIPSSSGKIIDIIHSRFPRVQMPYVSDMMVLTQAMTMAAMVDAETLNFYFITMAITQFLRIFCMASTILPPLKNYHDKYRLGGINGSGTEYIFSGHACYAAISFIHLVHIVPWYVLIPYNIVSQSLIVLSHNHYTVDIILSWMIVPLVYLNVFQCNLNQACHRHMNTIFRLN